MANPQHVEWLLEGVEAWNARREREEFFVADLRGAEIYQAFKDAGSLTPEGRIPLDGTNFFMCNLAEAILKMANLRGALFGSNTIADADLRGADLRDTFLGDSGDPGPSAMSVADADIRTFWQRSDSTGELRPAYTDLRGATLDQPSLDSMNGDTGVILPEGLHHPPHWPDPEVPEDEDAINVSDAPPSESTAIDMSAEDFVLAQQAPLEMKANLTVAVRSRSTAEIRQSLMANYGDASSLAQYMVDQIQREIAAHRMIPAPNEEEKLSEYNARLNFLRETLIVVESLHARIPASSDPELSEQDAKNLKASLVELAAKIDSAIRYLDSHDGTYGNLWKIGMIGLGTSLLGLFGISGPTGIVAASGVIGVSAFRVILERKGN